MFFKTSQNLKPIFKNASAHPCASAEEGVAQDKRLKAGRFVQLTTTALWLRAQSRPSTQIAKVFVGRAFVSVHLRPVSTPSLRSVGHSSQVLGTQAQYKLATSQCLNVVRNAVDMSQIGSGCEWRTTHRMETRLTTLLVRNGRVERVTREREFPKIGKGSLLVQIQPCRNQNIF